MFNIYQESVNGLKPPVAVKRNNPIFGWKLKSDKPEVFQVCYRITVKSEKFFYDSGEVLSSNNYGVCVSGLVLPENSVCKITLIVKNNYGETAWSEFEVYGDVSEKTWAKTAWIKAANIIDGCAPAFGKRFSVKNVKRATLYVSGLGAGAYYLNGKRVEDYYLDPPFSNYEKTVYYRRIDVTDFIAEGENSFCAIVGEGFYAQNRAWQTYGSVRYGNPCLRALFVIESVDGKKRTFGTDGTWRYKYTHIILNNVYGGEIFDARLYDENLFFVNRKNGWRKVDFDGEKGELTLSEIPPVREIRRIKAKSLTPVSGVKDGAFIADMGENFGGIVELRIPYSPAGSTYVMRYAETLNADGSLDFRSAGTYANQMIQQDIYIAKGVKGEVYKPTFTYHGFRYVEITGIHDVSKGYGTQPKAEMIEGIALSTDFEKTGEFTCSDKNTDTLFRIMQNTYRSNFIGFPTDCPTRERCGWLGDAQMAARFGLLSYRTAACYSKYIKDVIDSYGVYGYFTNIAPGKRTDHQADPLWGAAIVLIPYYAYIYCGDEKIVYDAIPYMEKWIVSELERINKKSPVRYGDWDPPCGNDGERKMPTSHTTAFCVYELCAIMARLSKRFPVDGDYYGKKAEELKTAIINDFYDKRSHDYGFWGSDGAALKLGLYPDGEEDSLLHSLLNMIEKDEYELSTGLYGTTYLVPEMIEKDCGDVAYRSLFNPEKPSYLTMLNDGATSVWETLAQKAVNPKDLYVLSYNHPMHGDFLYCVYTSIAGITPIKAGFSEFNFRPAVFNSIGDYKVRLDTVAGEISVSKRGELYRLKVPVNTVCTVGIAVDTVIIDGKKRAGETKLFSGEYEIKIIKGEKNEN